MTPQKYPQQMKQDAAKAALRHVPKNQIIGIGTGSTVNFFIEQLATIKECIVGAVASSEASAALLQAHGIPVLEFKDIDSLPIYFDGADEFNSFGELIKGGGGALTREKILAYASKKFICIADESKTVSTLGTFPVAVEVIPMARSYVAHELTKLGGRAEYRTNFVTDNGNNILDVYGWQITDPIALDKNSTKSQA
jgi:ribose 5-phosphate isomerase A